VKDNHAQNDDFQITDEPFILNTQTPLVDDIHSNVNGVTVIKTMTDRLKNQIHIHHVVLNPHGEHGNVKIFIIAFRISDEVLIVIDEIFISLRKWTQCTL